MSLTGAALVQPTIPEAEYQPASLPCLPGHSPDPTQPEFLAAHHQRKIITV